MRLMINGEPRDVSLTGTPTVAALLRELKNDGAPCAVELNRAIIPHTVRDRTELHDGDVIEIVTFVGGG